MPTLLLRLISSILALTDLERGDSHDLFGGEISSNAADAFAAGLKGRYKEMQRYEDHSCIGTTHRVETVEHGQIVVKDVATRNALNEILRDDYVADCERGVGRWNKVIEKAGIDFEFKLPSRRFHRQIGNFSNIKATPSGEQISDEVWEGRCGEWLPNQADEDYVRSLMQPVIEPGKIAGWIAPPRRGINGNSFDFEYVRLGEKA